VSYSDHQLIDGDDIVAIEVAVTLTVGDLGNN